MARKKRTLTVIKANSFIEASYKLSIAEQKIILTLASVIQPNDEDFKKYSFAIKDFMTLLGITNQNKYEEVRKTTLSLLNTAFEFRFENGIRQVAWLAGAEYHEGQGMVTLQFSPWLMPFLLQLKSHFTKYRLENITQLRSNYSVRIYELLKQYQLIGERFFKVDDLRHILYIEEEYPLYADFKKNVILMAQRELEKKTDICFEFEEKKNSRKVVGIRFKIKNNPNKQAVEEVDLFADQTISPLIYNLENPELKRRLHDVGFKPQRIAAILKKHDADYINENLDIAEKGYKDGSVKDLPAFAYAAIKEDYRKILTEIEQREKAEYEQLAAKAEAAATSSEPFDPDTLSPEFRAYWEKQKKRGR